MACDLHVWKSGAFGGVAGGVCGPCWGSERYCSREDDMSSKTPRTAWWLAWMTREVDVSRAGSMADDDGGNVVAMASMFVELLPRPLVGCGVACRMSSIIGMFDARRSTRLMREYAASRTSLTAGDDNKARVFARAGNARAAR